MIIVPATRLPNEPVDLNEPVISPLTVKSFWIEPVPTERVESLLALMFALEVMLPKFTSSPSDIPPPPAMADAKDADVKSSPLLPNCNNPSEPVEPKLALMFPLAVM